MTLEAGEDDGEKSGNKKQKYPIQKKKVNLYNLSLFFLNASLFKAFERFFLPMENQKRTLSGDSPTDMCHFLLT